MQLTFGLATWKTLCLGKFPKYSAKKYKNPPKLSGLDMARSQIFLVTTIVGNRISRVVSIVEVGWLNKSCSDVKGQ